LLRSASKLKRGVIEGTGELFWFFVIVDFSSPIFFLGFMCRESWWGHCPCIVFSQIYFILLCLFFVGFFFSTWCCQYYMIYWTHPLLNCWQNRPKQWGCRKGKKYLFNYIGLHIFAKCEQKNLFTMPSIDQ
jgi:hypothetical protein